MSEIEFKRNGILTRVRAVSDGIIRITRTGRASFLDRKSVVTATEGQIDAAVTENDETMTLETGLLSVTVDGKTYAMKIADRSGRLLLREPDCDPYELTERPVYLNTFDPRGEQRTQQGFCGKSLVTPVSRSVDRMAYECRQRFVFDGDEALYGLGSHEEGIGNLRGHMRYLYQHNMKAVVPVIVSTKGWGILFDMGCLMTFRDDENGSYVWAELADEMDWYFFYGDGSYASAMAAYRTLTGQTPMLPLYALGYVQSKERYADPQEMLSVADEYRRRGIPLDVLVLDWLSWPDGQWGWKTFDPVRFPDPERFLNELHDRHVRFMISVWPVMRGDNNADLKEMLNEGCMLGNGATYDAFSPKARELYWKQAANLFDRGVDAWWCDDSEPFETDWSGSSKPEPHDRVRLNTEEARWYLDPTRLNMYSLYHSMGMYTGQRAASSDKRVLNLTRSSFAGQHRYAAVTWSGDVSASWETLRRHVPEGMNFCAAGEPYWTCDAGAFFPYGSDDCWFIKGEFPDGCKDPGYRELFTRWMQYAAFLPMMRAHGTGTPREIWRFGEKGELFYDAIAQAIRIRYRMLPYLYSLMAKTSFEGLPSLLVPALVFPDDDSLRGVSDQMMVGESLLVRPVTHPMYYGPGGREIDDGNRTVQVRLPNGHTWYEAFTGKAYQGGRTIAADAAIDRIPVFARSGAILPLIGPIQHTGEAVSAPMEIVVCPGEDGVFSLYEDAGDGYGYEKGEYARVALTWNDGAGELTIGKRAGSYPAMPHEKEMLVRLNGKTGRKIVYTGEEIRIRL